MEFMMSATRQGLSRTSNYYISTSPALEVSKDSVRGQQNNSELYTPYNMSVSDGPLR